VGHGDLAKTHLKKHIIGILEGCENVKEKVLFVDPKSVSRNINFESNDQKLNEEMMTAPLIVYDEEEDETCGKFLFLKNQNFVKNKLFLVLVRIVMKNIVQIVSHSDKNQKNFKITNKSLFQK
jgi:hypothetical protein